MADKMRVSVPYLRHLATLSPDSLDGKHFASVADLLEAQQAEIERLRAAGDALATNYEIMLNDRWSAFSAAFLAAWREARRG